jgi:heme-degrading monooxygenase HmoA
MGDQPYFHIIIQRFDDKADESFFRATRSIVERVRRKAPGVLETYFAPNVSAFAAGWSHVRMTKFASRASHEAFQVSPIHEEAVQLMLPRMRYAVGDLDLATMTQSTVPPTEVGSDGFPYYHIVLFRAKWAFDSAFLAKLRSHQARIVREIPGLIEYHFEENISSFGDGWDWVHLSKFTSREAHDAYQEHDAHHALRDVLMPQVEDAVAGDVDTSQLM